jgi:hypothetical protein
MSDHKQQGKQLCFQSEMLSIRGDVLREISAELIVTSVALCVGARRLIEASHARKVLKLKAIALDT